MEDLWNASILLIVVFVDFLQIRVVNAFRMGLEADSFDKRSLSSLHSQQSIQNLRLQAIKRSVSSNPTPGAQQEVDAAFNRSPSYPYEDSRV